jgi:hypothetical protein
VQTWHLGETVTTQTTDGPYVRGAGSDGAPLILIAQALTGGVSVAAIKGHDDPPQGQLSSLYGEIVPGWALEYRVRSTNSAFVTLLAAGPYAQLTPTIDAKVDSTTATATVCAGDAKYDVRITNQASHDEAVTVTHASGCP